MKDSETLRREWLEHRFFRYRGCAPDPDDPGRAVGDPSLSLDAWHGVDRDGAEPQKERRAREAAAKRVCLSCPVVEACAAYASSVTVEGKLAQPDGVWGGRLAGERRAAFNRRRHEVVVAVPDRMVRTPQKRAVLLALAMCMDPQAVADAAGVDLRTANWQRSRLVTQLNLRKGSATRGELLAEAVRRGLLDEALVVADDGSVPAVPPPTRTVQEPETVTPAVSVPEVAVLPQRRSRWSRSGVRVMPGQLSFDDALAPSAPVRPLFANRRLEAAA